MAIAGCPPSLLGSAHPVKAILKHLSAGPAWTTAHSFARSVRGGSFPRAAAGSVTVPPVRHQGNVKKSDPKMIPNCHVSIYACAHRPFRIDGGEVARRGTVPGAW